MRLLWIVTLWGSLSLACPALAAAAEVARVDDGGFEKIGANDWPWWRGRSRDGVATGALPPLKWSDTENVLWKVAVSGRGHSSPIIVGERIYLATADVTSEVQSVLCYDRATGRQLWQTTVHQGNFEKKGNGKSTPASSSVACDGEQLYINFNNSGAVYTTALTVDGKQVWQTRITDFVMHQGFGSSPALYRSLVLVSADNKGTGALAALDRATGKIVWRVERPQVPNYTSPIILRLHNQDQVLFTGCDLVTSLDPLSGKKLWEIAGSTTECVTSTVTDGERIFTSGGYPKNHLAAVTADGSGKIAWQNNSRVYVPSLIVKDGYLYGVLDAGVAMCWKSDTGEEVWKGRLGGTFSASPVLVGDTFIAINEAGKAYVFKAQPQAFELIGENQLGDETFATPTICGGRMYVRGATTAEGKRQEWLWCVGK